VNGAQRVPQDPDDWDLRQLEEPAPLADGEAGDASLYARLTADGFTGPAFEQVMDRLCSYAYQVIGSWMATGKIFAKCAEIRIKGLPRAEDWHGWTREDLEDLAQETVAEAARKFRSNGQEGKGWQPGRGTALTSYFTSGCVIAFGSTYKTHKNKKHRRDRDRGVNQAAGHPAMPPNHASDVADTVAGHLDTVKLIAQQIPDRRLRTVMYLHANGWSNAEISQVLADGTTPKAVEGMIYRCKRKNGEDRDGRQ